MTMMEHDKPLVGSRRRFTEELKADATALVLNGERSIPRRSPDCWATSATDLRVSRTIRTAPALNSGSYCLRISGVMSGLSRFLQDQGPFGGLLGLMIL